MITIKDFKVILFDFLVEKIRTSLFLRIPKIKHLEYQKKYFNIIFNYELHLVVWSTK